MIVDMVVDMVVEILSLNEIMVEEMTMLWKNSTDISKMIGISQTMATGITRWMMTILERE
jgi:hypothetical protein